MTSVRKIDGRIGERTDGKIVESIEERIVRLIVVKTAGRTGKSIVERITERISDRMQAVSSEVLIEPIMWPASMAGKGAKMPGPPRWIARSDRSEWRDRKKSNVQSALRGMKDRSDPRDRRNQNGPRDQRNRSGPDETECKL